VDFKGFDLFVAWWAIRAGGWLVVIDAGAPAGCDCTGTVCADHVAAHATDRSMAKLRRRRKRFEALPRTELTDLDGE